MVKISNMTADTSPTDSDVFPFTDVETNTSKKTTRNNLLTANPIIDPTINGSNDGEFFTGKYTGIITGTTVPSSVTHNGNRNYTLVFNSVNYLDRFGVGTAVRTTRTTSAPTQCASFNGSTQYYVKTSPSGFSFTDDFVVMAWVKLTGIPGSGAAVLVSKYNGTSGFTFEMGTDGLIYLIGRNGGSSNQSYVKSYSSPRLNRWVHISAQLDMSAFSASTTESWIMYDGQDQAAQVLRGGTNPTSLTQAGNLEIGSNNGGTNLISGYMAQVGIFSAKVTQATVRGYMNQGLTGNETSLISGYSLSNSTNDLNTGNANNLTGNGSIAATTADSPFAQDDSNTPIGTKDWGVVMTRSFSTNTTITVQVPEGCTIPTSGGISAIDYSPDRVALGFISDKGRWEIQLLDRQATSITASGTTSYNTKLSCPAGGFNLYLRVYGGFTCNGNSRYCVLTLSTDNATETNVDMDILFGGQDSGGTIFRSSLIATQYVYNSAITDYYLIAICNGAIAGFTAQNNGKPTFIKAIPACIG